MLHRLFLPQTLRPGAPVPLNGLLFLLSFQVHSFDQVSIPSESLPTHCGQDSHFLHVRSAIPCFSIACFGLLLFAMRNSWVPRAVVTLVVLSLFFTPDVAFGRMVRRSPDRDGNPSLLHPRRSDKGPCPKTAGTNKTASTDMTGTNKTASTDMTGTNKTAIADKTGTNKTASVCKPKKKSSGSPVSVIRTCCAFLLTSLSGFFILPH